MSHSDRVSWPANVKDCKKTHVRVFESPEPAAILVRSTPRFDGHQHHRGGGMRRGIAAIVLIQAWASGTSAQEVVEPLPRSATIAEFTDSYFDRAMREMSVPGAAVVVIEAGATVLCRGYGVADVAQRTPVDPDATAFRLGSVGKTFTALAALQLVERGEMRLDAPISQYVARIPNLSDDVTLRRLLLHTAGFEERLIGYQTRDATRALDLAAHLRERMPHRRLPLTDLPSYSNYGYALVGLAVEQTSGLPFFEYVRRNIFAPLGMPRAFYAIPPLDEHARELAHEYRSDGDRVELSFSRPYPAGGVALTARDMESFITAMLAAAGGDPSRGIDPQIVRQALHVQARYVEGLEGAGFGFSQMRIANRLVWIKGGAAPKHSAVVLLMPEEGLGVFVALNRQEPTLWRSYLDALFERFFRVDDGPPAAAAQTPPRSVAGIYRLNRAASSTIEAVLSPMLQVRVEETDTGIRLSSPLGDLDDVVLAPAGGAVFRNPSRYAAFRLDSNGRPAQMFGNVEGEHFSFSPIPWWSSVDTIAIALASCVLILSSFPLARFAAFVWGRSRRKPRSGALAALWPVYGVVAAMLLLVASTMWTIADAESLAIGPTPALESLSAVAIVFLAASLGAALMSPRALRDTTVPLGARVHYAAAVLAAIGISAALVHYNVPFFRF